MRRVPLRSVPRRLRSRSIRARIVTLLLVPMVSLVTLWAFAADVTTREAWSMLQVSDSFDHFGEPVDDVVLALQEERRAGVDYLASAAKGGLPVLLRERQEATDRQIVAMRRKMDDKSARDALSGRQRQRVRELNQALDTLGTLRSRVLSRDLSWSDAIERYSAVIDVSPALYTDLTSIGDTDLAKESLTMIELARARELLAREDSWVTGLHAAGRVTERDLRQLAALVGQQRFLYQVTVPRLRDADRKRFEGFLGAAPFATVRTLEDKALTVDAAAFAKSVDAKQWRSTLDTSLWQVHDLNESIAKKTLARAKPYGVKVLVRAGIAGGVGLVAVIVSVVVSMRVARRLIRDLTGLRNSAKELAEVRLPQVIQRLQDGEQVDVAMEAPPILAASGEPAGEISQLARTFDEVQRTAIATAVEQAELRRGVSAVYLNIARRNQVLLHRQLSLLDRLERKAHDPEELADLFRLDHMTTRMRRHAEGLIILSGAAPGRAWRRPIPLVDVVRAAVGETEDYERVSVRPMPPRSLSGSGVADVTHLLAELVENATMFSPPHTQVEVRAEVVGTGVVVEVDDRGLGMEQAELDEANQRLAESPELRPSESDRLGLYVVSRLARRHTVEVTLKRSPYGGITAVVLLPDSLLAEPEQAPEAVAPLVEAPLPKASVVVKALSVPLVQADAVSVEPDAVTHAQPLKLTSAGLTSTGLPELPRRRRKSEPTPVVADDVADDVTSTQERSADEVRSLVSAFQRGTVRGREEEDPESPTEKAEADDRHDSDPQ